jgi:nitroreductase
MAIRKPPRNEKGAAVDMTDLVRKARTIRRFDEADRIPPETLRQLVDTARVVPSGGNLQPLRYRLVSSPAECDAIFAHLAWAGALKDWKGPAAGERPTGYIVVLASAERRDAPATDIGIAGQTIQLAAAALGYGACMMGAIDRPRIHGELGLPDAWAVHLVIALGRPAETVVLEPLPEGGETRYWRTEDGAHHVPKRSLDDVLIS